MRISLLCLLMLPASLLAMKPNAPVMPEVLTLEVALDYALENNFDILQVRERIREQHGLILEVRSRSLPQLEATSAYAWDDQSLLEPFGGQPASQHHWNAAILVRQLVYSGGNVQASLDAQQHLEEAALHEMQAVVEEVILEVKTTYYELLLAKNRIEVEEANVQLLEEELADAQSRFESGSTSQFEVLRAEVSLANAKPALIRVRNQLRVAGEELRRVLGYVQEPENSLTALPDVSGSLTYEPFDVELRTAIEHARANRSELRRLDNIIQAREHAITVAHSGYRPEVSLFGGYEARKSSLSDRVGDSVHGWTAGIQASWSIFDSGRTRGKIIQAQSRRTQAQLDRMDAQLAIEVQVRQAYADFLTAQQLVEASRQVVRQAEEALRLARSRYDVGSGTQLDVLESQVDLTDARNNEIEALFQYNVALASLRQAAAFDRVALECAPTAMHDTVSDD